MNKLSWRIIVVFIMALILTIIPLPNSLIWIRPPWILLFVLYLQFYLPYYFRILSIFIIGIIMDALLATIIGEHVFILCLMTLIANYRARCFHLLPVSQQMMLIGFFSMIYQVMIIFIDLLLGYNADSLSIFGIGLISMLMWPWLRLIGEKFLLKVCLNFRKTPKVW